MENENSMAIVRWDKVAILLILVVIVPVVGYFVGVAIQEFFGRIGVQAAFVVLLFAAALASVIVIAKMVFGMIHASFGVFQNVQQTTLDAFVEAVDVTTQAVASDDKRDIALLNAYKTQITGDNHNRKADSQIKVLDYKQQLAVENATEKIKDKKQIEDEYYTTFGGDDDGEFSLIDVA